ncbi:hypothetical protein BHM03_00007410 [Ensete ventricosum]|nr:hypothetical protein BHM03_00007410 [Ensete ventricosum]
MTSSGQYANYIVWMISKAVEPPHKPYASSASSAALFLMFVMCLRCTTHAHAIASLPATFLRCRSRSQPRHHPLQQPLPLLAAVAFPSSTTEITLSHITLLLPSSSSTVAAASCCPAASIAAHFIPSPVAAVNRRRNSPGHCRSPCCCRPLLPLPVDTTTLVGSLLPLPNRVASIFLPLLPLQPRSSILRCSPYNRSRSCRCYRLPLHPHIATSPLRRCLLYCVAPTSAHFLCSHTKYDVTDVMAMDDALDARFKAFEARIKRLQELLREFKRSRSETYDHGQDTGYPRMREEFPRWEDRDPIG